MTKRMGFPLHLSSALGKTSCGVVLVTILGVQAWLLRAWVVDDAAISMSYARNWWHGFGFVAQAGAPHVEGFSNPLWVVLLGPLSGLETNIIAVKCLSLGLATVATWRLAITLEEVTGKWWAGWTAGLLLALQPSVTIWSQSGLENALTLLLGVELLRCLQQSALGNCERRFTLRAGMISALLVLTRPEGIVYAGVYPLLYLLVRGPARASLWPIALSSVFPAATWIGYEVFRRLYFGVWLPNTYLAKGGVTLARVKALLVLDPYVLQTWQELSGSVFGYFWQSWGIVGLAVGFVVLWRRGGRAYLLPVGLMLGTALCLQVLLPTDWMEEHRLATLLYPPLYALIVVALSRCDARLMAGGCAVGLLLWSGWQAVDRYTEFLDHPTISLSEVEQRSRLFEQWGARLGIARASILTADVGGILWRDRLTVVDLGMLVSRPIAVALGEYRSRPDRDAFREHVLGDVRPDFVATRAYHAWLAQLDDDPRFRRDYVAIREYMDTWVKGRYGQDVYAGDYVRRDLVETRPTELDEIRREAMGIFYPFCRDCPSP